MILKGTDGWCLRRCNDTWDEDVSAGNFELNDLGESAYVVGKPVSFRCLAAEVEVHGLTAPTASLIFFFYGFCKLVVLTCNKLGGFL